MRLEVYSLWRRLWERSPQSAPNLPVAGEVALTTAIPLATLVEPSEDERRSESRLCCHREAWLHPVSLVKNISWHAIVLDISSGGIGLAIERPVLPGTFFAVELPDMLSGTSKTYRASVVHAAPQGHNYWHIGCRWMYDLENTELDDLI